MAARLAGWLAGWLKQSTGEFHLASKYGKNASCSSRGINGVPRGLCVFRASIGNARRGTTRARARAACAPATACSGG